MSQKENKMKHYSLVGDVGGTNARLALCYLETGEISCCQSYSGLDYPSLESVVRIYLDEQSLSVEQACIAIACPIDGDQVSMTNHSWAFSIKKMQKNLDLKQLTIINDFTAISMAIPVLGPDHKVQLGGGIAQPNKPISVCGAGTGLGVAHLVQSGDRWLSLAGEGGHVDMASCTEQEDALIQQLRHELGHVSAERLLSGPGLVNIYKGLVISDHRVPERLTPKQVSDRALSGECHDCHRALSLFCVLMGRFAGNLALNLGTFGGVYIAGGLVPRFLEFFKASGFRLAFADKGRFKEHLEAIPVYVITHSQPGLLGAGAYLRQSLGIRL
jgi:glucokinase